MRPRSPLSQLTLRALLALPVCLAVWWFVLRDPLLDVLFHPVRWAALNLWGTRVFDLVAASDSWNLRTLLPLLGKPLTLAEIQLFPTRFTVVFPLFWGLVLATPIAPRRGLQLVGGTALVLVPTVVALVLLYAQFELGSHINHYVVVGQQPPEFWLLALPYPEWQYHAMAVGRQLSLLVLPTLIPVGVWAAFNQRWLNEAMRNAAASFQARTAKG